MATRIVFSAKLASTAAEGSTTLQGTAKVFDTEWGWGIEINEARKMLDLYIDNGGNFVDTANFYTNGSSEKMLGELLGEKRQQIVLSTKYTMNTHPGDPNGGNHRKRKVRSI